MVFAIRNVYVSSFIGANAVDKIKLTRVGAGLAPGKEIFSVWSILVNYEVTIAVVLVH